MSNDHGKISACPDCGQEVRMLDRPAVWARPIACDPDPVSFRLGRGTRYVLPDGRILHGSRGGNRLGYVPHQDTCQADVPF